MSESKMQLEDWLDDLCVRFIVNLPREELESVERICFQVEEAQWFYEDFIRPLDPALPSLSLKAFALRIFQHCPLMSQWSHYHHITAFSEFLAYKTRVPVRGAILLSEDMDEVVLVKGWKKGANWSFPRGKINKDEKDLDCAIREVYEETGFDVNEAGLVKDDNDVKSIEVTMREQHMRLYVFRGVPRETHFEPRTRKEISKIEWYKLSELPTLMKKSKQYDQGFAVASANKFYMVAPFMHPLKKWIAQQRKVDTKMQAGFRRLLPTEGEMSVDEGIQAVNGGSTPTQVPADMATTRVHPQVASSEDASAHLKRLLNINGAREQQPASGLSKSNALLALLRGGVQDTGAQTAKPNTATPSSLPAPVVQPQQSYARSTFSPEFPLQNQYTGQTTRDEFPRYSQPLQAPIHQQDFVSHAPSTVSRPPMNRIVDQPSVSGEFPSLALPNHHGIPQLIFEPTEQHTVQPHLDENLVSRTQDLPLSRKQIPAPYQRTGDPQFSQQAQYPRAQGPTVPAASELPPPKLTSHSLALLNVFKNGNVNAQEAPSFPVVPNSEKEPVDLRRPSKHQDYLLGLLKGDPAASSSEPAELAAQPSSPASKEVLRQPRDGTNSTKQGTLNVHGARNERNRASSSAEARTRHGAEAANKPSGRRSGSGTKRQPNKARPAQNTPSPITILPRPQIAQKEPILAAEPSRTPPQPRSQRAKVPEPTKPSQPQILRRGEKPDLGPSLPIRSREPRGYGDGDVDQTAPALKNPQIRTDAQRRPSQPAQKDMLLSLFGKASASSDSLPAAQLEPHSSKMRSSTGPNNMASPPPLHLPNNGGAVPGLGTSTDGVRTPSSSGVESPSNKAFLLGFLEGVAKGNK